MLLSIHPRSSLLHPTQVRALDFVGSCASHPASRFAEGMRMPAAAKRPRRECSTPALHGLNDGSLAAAAPAAAAADTAVPMTPQLLRRTSAPY